MTDQEKLAYLLSDEFAADLAGELPRMEGDNADDAHVAFRVKNEIDGKIYRLTVETLTPMLRLSPGDKALVDKESS